MILVIGFMTWGRISFHKVVGIGSLSQDLDAMPIMILVTSSSMSGSNFWRIGIW